MAIQYPAEIIELFDSPQHKYIKGEVCDLVKGAGDLDMGEYVNLHFRIERSKASYIDARIVTASFSAMGSVMIVAAAEKFCSLIVGKTFREALLECDELRKMKVSGREHSIDFVIQAFYKSLESLSNLGIT